MKKVIKKVPKKTIFILFISIFFLVHIVPISYGYSFDINAQSDKTTLNPGEDLTLTFTIDNLNANAKSADDYSRY